MVENTKIEWAHHTFNPWEGCTKAGPGCDHCYAERRNNRFHGGNWGPGAPRRRTSPATWGKPLSWNRQAADLGTRYRVFCASLADWLDNEVAVDWLADLLNLIRCTPHLDWLLLSKRIGNWEPRLRAVLAYIIANYSVPYRADLLPWLEGWLGGGRPPSNVWLGVTVVNQAEADRDIPKLLDTPAALRWLSMEPLLGEVNLTQIPIPKSGSGTEYDPVISMNVLRRASVFAPHIDWVIVGGESGPGARPMHPDWARSLRDQCAKASTPFLFKQWGEWQVASHENGHYSSDMVSNGAYWVDLNGNTHKPSSLDLLDPIAMVKVGKARAGRMLDGQQHDGFPAAPAEGH